MNEPPPPPESPLKQFDNVPPIGDVDLDSAANPISAMFKFMFIKSVVNKLVNYRQHVLWKVLVMGGFLIVNLSYNYNGWLEVRPKTIYEHIEMPRTATMAELAHQKKHILRLVKELEYPTMSEEMLHDVFSVLLDPGRREMYDLHNQFYSDEIWKSKGYAIPNHEKYLRTC